MSNNPQPNKPNQTSFLTDQGDTLALPDKPLQRIRPPSTARLPEPKAAVTQTEDVLWKIVFYLILDTVRPVNLELTHQVVIGRADAAQSFKPDFDLMPYGAQEAGVSRRHAVLFSAGTALYIRDLGSTNGTRINGLRLAEQQSYKLHEGDEIEIGHIRMTLHMARTAK